MRIRLARTLWLAAIAIPGAALSVGCDGDEPLSGTTTASTTSDGGAGGAGGQGGAGGAGGAGEQASIDVSLGFEARVGDQAFGCAITYPGLGTAATEVALTDFRLYIHDVRLILAEGGGEVPVTLTQDGLWQYQDLALLDFEDGSGACANGTAEVNTLVRGTAPAGSYDGVAFKLGVPAALNHADASAAPSPLNLTAMFWNWNVGYKFLRIDSIPVGAEDAFNLHLGSTGCAGDPLLGEEVTCAWPNRAEIVLTGFDPLTTPVRIDYAAVVEGSDLAMDEGGAVGCMSGPMDPECAAIFERLGLSLVDGTAIPGQQLFGVE